MGRTARTGTMPSYGSGKSRTGRTPRSSLSTGTMASGTGSPSTRTQTQTGTSTQMTSGTTTPSTSGGGSSLGTGKATPPPRRTSYPTRPDLTETASRVTSISWSAGTRTPTPPGPAPRTGRLRSDGTTVRTGGRTVVASGALAAQ